MNMDNETRDPSDWESWFTAADFFQMDVFAMRHPEFIGPRRDPGPISHPTQAPPSDEVTWGYPVRSDVLNVAALASLIAAVPPGQFGIAYGGNRCGDRDGQVLAVSGSGGLPMFGVEIMGGAVGFAQRVFRGSDESEYPEPVGHHLVDLEVFDSVEAAEIVWGYLHEGLPQGYASTLKHLPAVKRARYRLKP